MAWALKESKDILKEMTQKHAQRDDPNKEPPSTHPGPKNVCIRTSFLEQAIPGTWSKPLAKEIVPNSPLCNRVANEYDTDHVQKQVNVIQDRSFCNQPAVCNSRYGTVSISLLI